jgi:putative CocE/NonD family hydrolase
MDEGFSSQAPVHYYTMGEERWRSTSVWPPSGLESQTLFLGGGNSLIGEAGSHDEETDRYQVDEASTSGRGSRWGLIVGTGVRRGYGDLRERKQRLLSYSTPPLPAALEVTGHPVVRLFLDANACDGAVFAYLEDVRPNGEVRYVTEGQLRLIHRTLSTSPPAHEAIPYRTYRRADGRPLAHDEVAEVVFDLLPTSFVFRAGHAIRLTIAGADADHFDSPPGTAPLVYRIHRDRQHPSRIELPASRTLLRSGPTPAETASR